MKAKQAIVCPKCGALNRPNWAFCARCNESLEGAQPAADQAPAAPSEDAEARPSSLPANAILLGTLLVLAAVAVATWRYSAQAGPPKAADPSLFKIATNPVDLPPAQPPTGPGAADHDEGRRLMNAGDLAGALVKLAAAAAADPGNAEYRSVYGIALGRSGDQEGALAAHAEAARLDPRFKMQYARSLDLAGRSTEAARLYEDLLAKNPAAATVHEDLGRLLYRGGAFAKAAPHLQRAAQARPDDPVLKQELAYALDQAGDKARAVALYREVLKKAPQATISRGLLAQGLFEQGQKEEALSVLSEGLKATPDAPGLQLTLGSLLERSGRRGEAAAAYRAYARLAPNAPDAREVAARAARLAASTP